MSQPAWRVEPRFEDTTSAAARERRLEIRFTGSGSEYFRIWIVNLLLTIVTLTLYHPWAKVRRLRYFYGNTLVDGQPLDFHGNPWIMLRGYLLVGAMVGLYSVAGRFSPVAGLVAFLVVAVVWPALLKASLQFRLANTSWRGLRFRFTGGLGGAYGAVLPMFLLAVVFFGVLGAAGAMSEDRRQPPPPWVGVAMGSFMLLAFLLGPWLWWKLKKYQHDHYALGTWQTRLEAGRASFYGVFAKTSGVALLAVAVAGGLAALLIAGIASSARGTGFAIAAFLPLLLVVLVQFVPRPYFTSRMQNLLWSRTVCDAGRFDSALRFRPLLGLTLKNVFLTVLTLGLYWPFAAVATHRMRVQAVSILLHADIDDLVDRTRAEAGDAAGDAAGDLLGLDIGL